jgi:CheY-like chemotaxis protein
VRNSRAKPVVLVVENEPLIRIMASEMVETAGLAAIEAADAVEAIEVLQNRHDIRIVFSDVKMPGGLDGLQLASIVRDRWPLIEIVLTSGHVTKKEVKLPTGAVFFQKPYRTEDVVSAFRQMAR